MHPCPPTSLSLSLSLSLSPPYLSTCTSLHKYLPGTILSFTHYKVPSSTHHYNSNHNTCIGTKLVSPGGSGVGDGVGCTADVVVTIIVVVPMADGDDDDDTDGVMLVVGTVTSTTMIRIQWEQTATYHSCSQC